tara:strand:+ start:17342 stop:17893 length:552 start_codon:yes stop_codon:yes gene_type:complete
MDTDSFKNYLTSFGKQVANRSKANLARAKGGKTNLGQTIKFSVTEEERGVFSVKFFMADYGEFLDKGVSGYAKTQSYKDFNNKVVSSPYNFKRNTPPIPPGILAKWVKKKGLKGRDKKSGRFITNLSLAFIIGRKIKRDGIKSLSFFQKPLGLGLKEFDKGMMETLKTEINNTLAVTEATRIM